MKRVLIVDDDATLRDIYGRAVSKLPGVQVHLADDCDTGIERAAQLRPDLVLLDLKLPDGDGTDLAWELRELLGEQTPIIAISGSILSRDDVECPPFVASLGKPFDLDTLRHIVALHLNRSPTMQTSPPPAAPAAPSISPTGEVLPAKPFYRQKRFWLGLAGLVGILILGLRAGRSWLDILTDDKTLDYIAAIAGVGGVVGAYIATMRGSRATAFGNAPPPLPPKPEPPGAPPKRNGFPPLERRVPRFVGAVAVLWLMVGACASAERNGHELEFRVRNDPARPRPACLYRLSVDNELLHHGSVDECPAVPVCEEPTP